MTDTGFFKWIWRFNALAIAAVAVGALALMTGALLELAGSALRANRVEDVLAVPQADGAAETPAGFEENFHLGLFEVVEGTRLLRGELRAEQSYDYGFSSKQSVSNLLNLLYLDPARGEQRWLFPAGRRLIVSTTDIERPESATNSRPRLQATLFHVVTEDSSGDGRLSPSDSGALMISAADGTDLRVLADGVSATLQSGPLNEAEQFVVFEDAGGRHLLRLDVASRTEIGRMDLSGTPPAQ